MSTDHTRRKVIAALGLALPLAIPSRSRATEGIAPKLGLVSVEEGLIVALRSPCTRPSWHGFPCVRVEVGHADLITNGVQGCVNSRPFAGFPRGHLRIVRTGSGPGPIVGGVRLYVATLDIVLTGGRDPLDGRLLDFAALPPAPRLLAAETVPHASTLGTLTTNPRPVR